MSFLHRAVPARPRVEAPRHPVQLALSDSQRSMVMVAATCLDPSKRGTFLERVAARILTRCSRHPSDGEVDAAVREVLGGLVQRPAA